MKQGRIISIDYGLRRCGIAVSDPLQIIASPLKTIAPSLLIPFLNEYTQKEIVDVILLGLPYDTNNKPTDITNHILVLYKKLDRLFPLITLKTIDERYTSKIAAQELFKINTTKKQKRDKSRIDRVAAALFLKDYLDQQSSL